MVSMHFTVRWLSERVGTQGYKETGSRDKESHVTAKYRVSQVTSRLIYRYAVPTEDHGTSNNEYLTLRIGYGCLRLPYYKHIILES